MLQIQAQDPEFTQFYANKLYLNPAFAGTNGCPRVSLNYRNQWPSLTGAFVTNSFSFDREIRSIGGIGLLVLLDVAAKTIRSTRVSGIYSKQIRIDRITFLRLGFEATYFQKSLDWSKLTFGDQIDAKRGFVYTSSEVKRDRRKHGIDFSGGALLVSGQFYAGIALHHVTEPNESLINGEDANLPIKYTAHAGAKIPVNKHSPYQSELIFISPNILFRRQGSFEQLNLGLYVNKGILWGGIWYRNADAFITSVGLQTKQFKIGYSYDVTTSKLTLESGGAHEISLGILFPCKPRKPRFRPEICPSF